MGALCSSAAAAPGFAFAVIACVWLPALAFVLLTDSVPGDGDDVYVYYGKLHTLNADSSTIPAKLEDLVALGASGYAAMEWASFAANRVNVGGADTWRSYLTWGQDRLAEFMKGLAKHSRKNTVRVRQLYAVF